MQTCQWSVSALLSEVTELLSKGAISEVPEDLKQNGFYSRYFLVPKRTGGVRPILDLRNLNAHVAKRPFRMLTTGLLLEAFLPGDFCSSIDLKDAYFHVPIVRRHRKFFRFAFLGKAYEYTRIPFGYALVPRTFSKCLEAALEPLRREGIRILAYLDDLLILASSLELARSHTVRVVSFLTRLGLAARPIMSLLGMMAAAHKVVPLGLLHMRSLQAWFARQRVDPVRHRNRALSLPARLQGDLSYWRDPLVLSQGIPLGRVSECIQVFTDATLHRWGGVCLGRAVGGVWPPGTRHINLLELDMVLLVLMHFSNLVEGRNVLIRSDNRATVAYINRQGGVRSPALHRAATQLWRWACAHLRSLTAAHIPGHLYVGADMMSRSGLHHNEWRLHPDIVSLIWLRFGEARVDLFASRQNAHFRLWFSLSQADQPPLGVDAFSHHPWPRGLLYAFPPQRCIARLLARIRTEGLRVILVAPDRPSAVWYPEMIQLLVDRPWPIPPRLDALSQAEGSILHPPVLSGALKVWHLSRSGF
ncbi:uncharacterized protein LOC105006635 [Esox lucius]|uniref:uncharacterized protein LOC105006635 n=1 Tax=Esox lucius TaxID=8010 RepID=UPI0014777BF6|nr:uncharacterized protein LOC105006635 [Esox lucius]